MTDQIPQGQHQHLPQTVPGPPPYSSLDKIAKSRLNRTGKSSRSRSPSPVNNRSGPSTNADKQQETSARSRSRSPHTTGLPPRSRSRSPCTYSSAIANPNKKQHTLSDSDSEQDLRIDDPQQLPTDVDDNKQQLFTFLLTNFDPKFQNTKQLLHQFLKYVPRTAINELKPTRNGIIIKTTERTLAQTIRNKHTFEIFGKSANITSLADRRMKQTPPPRKPPALSVVIRGVQPILSNEEIESELREEGHNIIKCLRIMCNAGPTYLVRVLTNSQETINTLLTQGAYIYRHRYRVEPSHSPPPLPVRCERCQQYSSHPTHKCSNQPTCAFCSGPHGTKVCPNMHSPPKCNTCNEQHPTFSYKCKGRPTPETSKPELVVPIRTHEASTQASEPTVSIHQPITIEKVLALITLVLQNIHPFQRHHILQQVQYAARTILQVSFTATYSGPYAYFHTTAHETAV